MLNFACGSQQSQHREPALSTWCDDPTSSAPLKALATPPAGAFAFEGIPPVESAKTDQDTSEAKKITPGIARKFWIDAGKPGFRRLAELLKAAGYTVSSATLHRWKTESPAWLLAYTEAENAAEPEVVIQALAQAERDGRAFKDAAYGGVKARLVARLYESITVMPISDIEEWHKALDAVGRLDGLIHAVRGREIAAAERPNGGSVIHAFEPKVQVAKFANGNGKA